MSDDFASLVNKLNEMSTENYKAEEDKTSEQPSNEMRDILSRFNEANESKTIATKGNIKIEMTEQFDDGYNLDVLIDNKVVASGNYDDTDKVFHIESDDFISTEQVLEAFASTAEDEGHEYKEEAEPVNEETPDEAYVNNMFRKASAMVNTLEKLFRIDGMMAQKIDAVGGDKTGLKDIQEALSNAYDAIEDGHYDAMAHIVPEGNLKQELEDYKHEYTSEAKNDCKEGEYFCNDEQKCKPIPEGYHVMPDGELVKDEDH